jgi:hypothetical protein
MLLEGGGVIDWFYTHDSIISSLVIILGSGMLAFCLNFSIFYVIHSATAVTFNVAGNLKVRLLWMMFLPSSFCSVSTRTEHHGAVGCCCGTGLMVDLPEPDLPYERDWMRNHTCWLYFLWVCEASHLPTAGCHPWEPKNEFAEELGGDAPPCRRQARQRLARQSIPLGS